MSHVARKPVFEVSDQVLHKPGCTAKGDGQRLKISGYQRRGIVLFYNIAKSKVLISCVVTAHLICAFVLACAKGVFSHEAAQIIPYVYE